MEIHQNFIYRKGLKFNFSGDDDVWAFVNDSLRMDLGESMVHWEGRSSSTVSDS